MALARLGLSVNLGGVAVLACALIVGSNSAMALDLASLWDFGQPALSEQRFVAALASASADDALILHTQIARSHGLRKDFAQARALLRELEPQMAGASAEASARFALELGRSYASASHDTVSPEDKALARAAYEQALATARQGQLDGLAIDAIHMLAFVDTAPADQLKWAEAALTVVQTSSQPAAKRWEGSVRNNIGYALHQLGRYDEALTQFQQAKAIRVRGGDLEALRVADWMVAWTLRALVRHDEALAIQLRLEHERDAAGTPSRYVFEELAHLYRALGDDERTQHYAQRLSAMPSP